MALIAVDAVVDIAVHLRVTEVVGVIASVAARALKDRIVAGVDVAGRAHAPCAAMVRWELRVLCVVEGRVQPIRRVVAGLTGRWEELRLRRMAGIGRVVVVGLVAADARDWQCCVIAVDMAIAALARRRSVRSRKGESRVVVIKGRVCPDSRVMAHITCRRESCRLVLRIIGAGVVLLVARVAERAVQ